MALIPDIKPIHVADGGSGGVRPYLPTESSDQPTLTDGVDSANGQDSNFDGWNYFWSLFGRAFGSKDPAGAVLDQVSKQRVETILDNVQSGAMTPLDAQKAIANDQELRSRVSPEQTEYLINMLEQFNAQQSYDRSIQSIKDSALAQQEAAIATGINPSAYIQGQSAGFNAAKAESSHTNVAMNRFNQKAQMARTMLGLVAGMASSGIYGSSMMAGKKAVAKLTTEASRDVAMIKRRAGRTHINTNGTITRDLYDYSW